jgi:hypothetical protein
MFLSDLWVVEEIRKLKNQQNEMKRKPEVEQTKIKEQSI